jgi:hypothetical protein
MNCLLCQSTSAAAFKVLKKPERHYFHCAECDFIFMDPAERLSPQDEKARYDLHQNQDDLGHRAFLRPLLDQIQKIQKSSTLSPSEFKALDYGCGAEPILGNMMLETGIIATNYDLFFRPDQDAFRQTYHLITSTEVWEHFYDPRTEIERLIKLLRNHGVLAIMTSGHKGEAAFHDWYYRRDPTHVAFFSEKTMAWLAHTFKLEVLSQRSPYWLFRKTT